MDAYWYGHSFASKLVNLLIDMYHQAPRRIRQSFRKTASRPSFISSQSCSVQWKGVRNGKSLSNSCRGRLSLSHFSFPGTVLTDYYADMISPPEISSSPCYGPLSARYHGLIPQLGGIIVSRASPSKLSARQRSRVNTPSPTREHGWRSKSKPGTSSASL